MTVQVEAGSIFFDGDAVDVVAQDNVPLAASDSTYPRKDVVYLDANGNLQVETGTAESAVPADSTRFQTRRPAPSDLSGSAATVLAEVWVAAGGADISTGDVRDRRVFAEISTGSVSLADRQVSRRQFSRRLSGSERTLKLLDVEVGEVEGLAWVHPDYRNRVEA